MGLIRVNGIRCYAYHGCLKEETVIGGEYLVDITLDTDLSKASASDNLEDTFDYSRIYEIVKQEMSIPSRLVEHVCNRILGSLKKEFSAKSIEVCVTKINPPVNGDVRSASVTLHG